MLTVLLSTRNRIEVLREVLESYCKLQSPPSGWKLVVIDNGSTDQTSEILASFTNRIPLQFIVEPTAGKNNALNAGVSLLEGDLAVFTDDDAFPRSDWLIELRKVADTQRGYSIFGGAIVPRWEVPPPPWIQWVEKDAVYSITNPSRTDGPIGADYVFGPNMAVRSSLFSSGVRFDPSFGPRGSTYPMGSETEFLMRLANSGEKAWFVSGAVVEHFIRTDQMKKSWVFGRAIRFGRGQYRLSRLGYAGTHNFGAETTGYFLRRLVRSTLNMALAAFLIHREKIFRSRWQLNYLLGLLIEARELARTKGSPRTRK